MKELSAARHDDRFCLGYREIAKRSGKGKAIIAVAREMTVAMYYMLIRKKGN